MPTYTKTELIGHVGVVTICNPPHNFATIDLLSELLDALSEFDNDPQCRATVLTSDGHVFCAGADLSSAVKDQVDPAHPTTAFYTVALKLFEMKKPMIVAVMGAAIGAGFGLALVADFRVGCPETTFAANFVKLGIHPGFGMSVTLPRIVGQNNAELLFCTGRRIKGEAALEMGALTELVDQENVLDTAVKLATEIASSSPQAVYDTRVTMRRGLVEAIRQGNQIEQTIQSKQMAHHDFKEGVSAARAKRAPIFSAEVSYIDKAIEE
jgi:enoyl-CoA hydratase/carnithine racemase